MKRFFILLAFGWAGCASDQVVEETTTAGGMTASQATVQQGKDGQWQTKSGDAAVAVEGQMARESELPYGGGDAGVREAVDSAPPENFGD
jgi:hypothetical protein